MEYIEVSYLCLLIRIHINAITHITSNMELHIITNIFKSNISEGGPISTEKEDIVEPNLSLFYPSGYKNL